MPRKGFAGESIEKLSDGVLAMATSYGYDTLTMNGEKRRVFWAEAPDTRWKVILNVPESEVLGPVNQLTLRSSVIAAAALAMTIFIVNIVARRATEPIGALTAAAESIETGVFETGALDLLR